MGPLKPIVVKLSIIIINYYVKGGHVLESVSSCHENYLVALWNLVESVSIEVLMFRKLFYTETNILLVRYELYFIM